MTHIHRFVTESEKAHYQNQARREKKSLGARLREAAEGKLADATRSGGFTLDDLRRFNDEFDAREEGKREPDWLEHKRAIAESEVHGFNRA